MFNWQGKYNQELLCSFTTYVHTEIFSTMERRNRMVGEGLKMISIFIGYGWQSKINAVTNYGIIRF